MLPHRRREQDRKDGLEEIAVYGNTPGDARNRRARIRSSFVCRGSAIRSMADPADIGGLGAAARSASGVKPTPGDQPNVHGVRLIAAQRVPGVFILPDIEPDMPAAIADKVHSILQESPRSRAANTRAQRPALLKGLIFGPTDAPCRLPTQSCAASFTDTMSAKLTEKRGGSLCVTAGVGCRTLGRSSRAVARPFARPRNHRGDMAGSASAD